MHILDDSTSNDVWFPREFGRGFDPSQAVADTYRPMFGESPDQMKLIPRSEWSARIKEKNDTKSSLWHLRQIAANGQQMSTLDQNGQGYCWAYSVVRCVMYQRALMNQAYKRLSAHAVGCMVKGFRDEGGWCGLSTKFIKEKGVPSIDKWPEKSMNRSNDKYETWQEAAGNAISEDWYDAGKAVYDQALTFDQVATCLLWNIPCALDFNWWGHSVCGIELVEVESGSFGIRIDNSWTDSWEERGSAILRGSKSIPDGAVGIRVINASGA